MQLVKELPLSLLSEEGWFRAKLSASEYQGVLVLNSLIEVYKALIILNETWLNCGGFKLS